MITKKSIIEFLYLKNKKSKIVSSPFDAIFLKICDVIVKCERQDRSLADKNISEMIHTRVIKKVKFRSVLFLLLRKNLLKKNFFFSNKKIIYYKLHERFFEDHKTFSIIFICTIKIQLT